MGLAHPCSALAVSINVGSGELRTPVVAMSTCGVVCAHPCIPGPHRSFISKEHSTKSNYGVHSPGPLAYKQQACAQIAPSSAVSSSPRRRPLTQYVSANNMCRRNPLALNSPAQAKPTPRAIQCDRGSRVTSRVAPHQQVLLIGQALASTTQAWHSATRLPRRATHPQATGSGPPSAIVLRSIQTEQRTSVRTLNAKIGVRELALLRSVSVLSI